MNEANYKGEVQRLWISSQPLKPLEGFENLKPSQTTIIYTMPDFPEPLETGYWV
jgi:hypothetical protein